MAGDRVVNVVPDKLHIVCEDGIQDVHYHFAISFTCNHSQSNFKGKLTNLLAQTLLQNTKEHRRKHTNNRAILEGLFTIQDVGGMNGNIPILSGTT